jgi:hypothetical protein
MAGRYQDTNVRMDPACVFEINRLATIYRMTPSAVVRMALESGLPKAERDLKKRARDVQGSQRAS